MPFPTIDEFEAMKTKEETIRWSDIEKEVIYKIEKLEIKNTKYGENTLIHIINTQGKKFRVWATSLLHKDLKNIERGDYYIKALEKIESRKNPGQYYYGYDLLKE